LAKFYNFVLGGRKVIRLIISGCNGYMGKSVTAAAKEQQDISIVAGFDIDTRQLDDFPVYGSPGDCAEKADVIVDFSNADALNALLEYAERNRLPLVLCSTGYTNDQIKQIKAASERFPVFRSGNMSLGINLLAELVRRACAVLGEQYDIEIVERHHRRKLDAPSGTALMLADAAAEMLPADPEYVCERESRRTPRQKHEIGISSVRGGTVVGQHDVMFLGRHEVIELRHTAESRDVFAVGAVNAARFMASIKNPGLYTMSDVLA